MTLREEVEYLKGQISMLQKAVGAQFALNGTLIAALVGVVMALG